MVLENPASGVEVVTRHLAEGLLAAGVELRLYTYGSLENMYFGAATRGFGRKSAGPVAKTWFEWREVIDLVEPEIEVFHSPSFMLPIWAEKNQPWVVTVHDFAFLRHPEFYSSAALAYYQLGVGRSLARADRILCVSHSCQADLAEFFGAAAMKSEVVSPGYRKFALIEPDDSVLTEFALTETEFLLTVGTLNARKNLRNSLRAFRKLLTVRPHLRLVIVGSRGQALRSAFADEIAAFAANVVFTGFISDAKLAALYRRARLVLFASYYEGFGNPVLEAMSVDAPLVLSNRASLPEVSGYPADLLCDPSSPSSIARLAERIISDDVLRGDLISIGRERLSAYSWEKMTSLTLQAYEGLGR
jgi:glycosyltransferase involved in cell wall biosynthesis